jgi:hypothetical protein
LQVFVFSVVYCGANGTVYASKRYFRSIVDGTDVCEVKAIRGRICDFDDDMISWSYQGGAMELCNTSWQRHISVFGV